ncbi:MAG: AI-2E family transporter [Planctomycetes bacterium]|nr:AI-2E family transporter [Planctomycetota bacterium]
MSQGRPPRPTRDLHLWEIRGIRDVLAAFVVASLFWLGYAMRDVTVPLLVALLLAYLFEPLIAWTAKARWIPFGRLGAVSWLLTIITVILVIGLGLLVPRVVSQAAGVVNDVQSGLIRTRLTRLVGEYVPPEYQQSVMEVILFLPESDDSTESAQASAGTPQEIDADAKAAHSSETKDSHVASSVLVDAAKNSSVDLLGIAGTTGRVAWAVVGKAIAIGMLAFLIPFYFFFFSLHWPGIVKFCNSLLPETHRPTIVPLLERMDGAVAGFVRGRIVIALIMAVLYAVGWAVIGVPYAILLSIIVGAFSLVPFLGLVGIPVAILLLAIAELDLPEAQRMVWWGVLLWPTVVFAIVNALDGWVLTPLVAGKATNLDPVTIFVAVLAGGSVMGAYGMLLAIPIAACGKILLSDLIIPKLRELALRPRADTSE